MRDRDGEDAEEFSSDDEQEESLERKLARLRREIAEVKGEVEQRKTGDGSKQVLNGEDTHDIEALNELLETVRPTSGFGEEQGAAARLTKRLAAAASAPSAPSSKLAPSSQQTQPSSSTDAPTTYTLTYAPIYNPSHTLSKVTSFETRLSALEAALGIDSLPLPTQDRPTAKPLLPTLDTLDRQLTTLTTSTDSSLDTLSRRVRQLISDTQTLESARKAARAAATEEPSTSVPSAKSTADVHSPEATALADPDNVAKIHALYGTLPTIESLAPLLPATLDRLRSLRALHADAGMASQTLRRVEERQESVREEIGEWRDGLDKVEKAVQDGAGRTRENAAVVEGWVRELEGRVEKLREVGS